jgi:hypothetical protein
VVELPVAVRAEPDEVVESVHFRDRRVERVRGQATFVTDFDVLVVAAAGTPVREGREVLTPCVLPESREATGPVFRTVRDGADRS